MRLLAKKRFTYPRKGMMNMSHNLVQGTQSKPKNEAAQSSFFRDGIQSVRFTLSRKITGAFLVVLLLLCVITAMSYTSLLKVNHSYSNILDNNIQIINDAQEIQYQTVNQIVTVRSSDYVGSKQGF
jgi:hypothetical protein